MNKLADIGIFDSLTSNNEPQVISLFNSGFAGGNAVDQIEQLTADLISDINGMLEDIKYVGTIEANCESGYKYRDNQFVDTDLIANIGYVKDRTREEIDEWIYDVREILKDAGAGGGAAASAMLY